MKRRSACSIGKAPKKFCGPHRSKHMSDLCRTFPNLLLEQQAIRAKCFHPSGTFVEFKKEEIEQSIPERFEQIVRRYPERIAVKTKHDQLTYCELNKAANRVAHAILEQGGKSEEPVALLIQHDAPMIAAILGVLKAGRICVPIDPSFPKERVGYMLEDSQASLIVTNTKNLSLARELVKETIPLLDIDTPDSDYSTENLCLSLSPRTLAYILYTSGSTGQPKGVVQDHRNVLYSVYVETNSFHISSEDRLSLLHPFSSSASVKYLFGALLNGASLFPFDLREEGLARLATWLIQEGITICDFITTVFRYFAYGLSRSESFPSLRLICLGSESVSKQDVELYKRYFHPNSILVILLATNETATIREYFIDTGSEILGDIVPTGYRVEGKEVLLLDDEGRDVTFNDAGEIAVKSCYLSLGYWRKPDLTEAKFLPDPSGGEERIYLTGDIGRMQPDGCLVHIGRRDFQVKIRGYRVEVGEVEGALMALESIKEAVVVAREDLGGDKRLVAYLVPAGKVAPRAGELRSFLKEKLPDYMVPSAFVMLEAMPRTPNGKVDRRALPDPGKSRPQLEDPFVAPRTPVEEQLAQIWAEVLSLDRVGVHDNFFESGGNSLTAARIVSQVLQRFQLELSMQVLFEAPTVAEMAALITQNRVKNSGEGDLEGVVAELESLSDDEAQFLLVKGDPERS